jgi:YgiT-type zinc finger domain-containing protein
MSDEKPRPCPMCGGEMRHETQGHAVKYRGHKRVVMSLGWWCSKCGDGILAMPALLASEKVFLELRADVDQHRAKKGAARR